VKYNRSVVESMSAQSPGEITQLLAEVQDGESLARSRLANLVYNELHRIASHQMRQERPDHSLQATALVDDAYVHLINLRDRTWQNRSHFFAMAAQSMRRILIDHARGHKAAKRGVGFRKVNLDDAVVIAENKFEEIIAVDAALTRLAEWDPRLSRVVEMRFYAGLTDEEIAEVLGLSARTVKRDWRVAKAWLHRELSGCSPDDAGSVAEN
jgi:RNA polymerase sigma factor (TIGR02999 family)